MLNFSQIWNNLSRQARSVKRFLLLVCLSSSWGLVLLLSPSIAEVIVPTEPQSPAGVSSEAPSEVGWEFLGIRELNQALLTTIEYEGDCPGTDQPALEARFSSSKTPPAPGRRAVIKNVTRGVASDPYPYTNREYTQGRSSEPTQMELGATHSGKRFRVLEGENKFEYEIKQGDRVIDSGSFTAAIEKQVDARRRDAVAQTQSICMNSSVALETCADVRKQTQYVCPGNRVLRTTLEPSDRSIKTLVSNQTYTTVNYTINGRVGQLSPGQDLRLEGDTLSIDYQQGCTSTCVNQSTVLQPGKRYQFKASQLDNKLVELVAFPQ
jgi:hypothetical protein